MDMYNISVKDMKLNDVSLEEYRGKVMLIVNTATGCGFTPQYSGLQELYNKYHEKGLEILDFPCNQFGNQAPGTEEEIHEFCTGRFGITFKQFAKVDVNGENESPLFTLLKANKSGMFGSSIKWNFTKFLVDRNGKVISRYSPNEKPEKIEEDILKLL